jgi:hypothetical protein
VMGESVWNSFDVGHFTSSSPLQKDDDFSLEKTSSQSAHVTRTFFTINPPFDENDERAFKATRRRRVKRRRVTVLSLLLSSSLSPDDCMSCERVLRVL